MHLLSAYTDIPPAKAFKAVSNLMILKQQQSHCREHVLEESHVSYTLRSCRIAWEMLLEAGKKKAATDLFCLDSGCAEHHVIATQVPSLAHPSPSPILKSWGQSTLEVKLHQCVVTSLTVAAP